MKGIEISNNQGVVNIADRRSNIQSDNIIKQNDMQNIIELVNSIKENIKDLNLDNNEKESIIDDVEVVQEQVQSNITKPTRIKKAFNNIKDFLTNTALLTGAGISLANNIQQLVTIVQPIIDKL